MFILEENTKSEKKEVDSMIVNTDNTVPASQWVWDFANTSNWISIIDSTYMNDEFNFHGLSSLVSNYKYLVQILRGQISITVEAQSEETSKDLHLLYIILHQRYLLTERGSKRIKDKFNQGVFGKCPRVSCNKANLLPIGFSPIPGVENAKAYCPNCQEVYETKEVVDGALFGPYFPHYYLYFDKDYVYNPKGTIKPTLTYLGLKIESLK